MNITINGKTVPAERGMTILDAARQSGIYVPTLCFLKGINGISACRVCVVEANGRIVPACSTPVSEEMTVFTDSDGALAARRRNLELICSDHLKDCTDCPRGVDCELRCLCRDYGVDDAAFGLGKRERLIDTSLGHLVRDNSKCLLCRRCEAVCRAEQTVGAIGVSFKGGETTVGFSPGLRLSDTACTGCGQCIAACPTGALSVRDDTKKVWKALIDKDKFTVAAVSPEVLEQFGVPFGDGENSAGRLRSFLRSVGFDLVLETAGFEEAPPGTRLHALRGERKPVIETSCPAVINFIRSFFPQLEGSVLQKADARVTAAQRLRESFPERDVFFVSIGNCTAAKRSPELLQGVDAVLTARETLEMFRRACVSGFTAQKVWGELEAATADTPEQPSAGPEKPREIADAELRACEASGLGNVRKALESAGKYDLLLLSACPGGCSNGGGTVSPRHRTVRLFRAEEEREE